MLQLRTIEENRSHIVSELGNSTVKYQGNETEMIDFKSTTTTSYYQSTFIYHLHHVMEKHVISITGLPPWFDAGSCIVNQEILGEPVHIQYYKWTVKELLLHLGENGKPTKELEDSIFHTVSRGHQMGSLVLEYKNGMGFKAT